VPDTVDTVPDTVPDTAGETFPPVTDGAHSASEFKSETEAFIEGSKVADKAGFSLSGAECETPASTSIGTTYTCWAFDDSGKKFVLGVEITDAAGFTVQSLEPA